MTRIVDDSFKPDAEGVWVPPVRQEFGYTDGVASEIYLEQVFDRARDLRSDSAELEKWIKDWPSEYHLTRARAQLLRAFKYDRGLRVLEVGCGCGAITRFLGETFKEVVAVEGSYPRARLARKRTRDLSNVTIINAPFEQLTPGVKFDIVFCIGVFEYSQSFIGGTDPYGKALESFREFLTPDGVLVLAIENQFGLKYFASSAEDHTGVMFDGIEGYPRFHNRARTFGHAELKNQLGRYFSELQFYFPYPDYKIPSCVVSEPMLEKVNVAELIGGSKARDYCAPGRRALFDQKLAWFEIARNRMIPDFSNSFLVLAGRSAIRSISTDWLGVSFSNARKASFSTQTRFVLAENGAVRVVKTRPDSASPALSGKLEHRPWSGEWIDGESLQILTARRCRSRSLTLTEIFEPSRAWFEHLTQASTQTGNVRRVPGSLLDSIWRNCFLVEGDCRFIDEEWSWTESLPLELVVIRGLYYFFQDLQGIGNLGTAVRGRRVASLISAVGRVYGLRFSLADFRRFITFETEFLRTQSAREQSVLKRGRLDLCIELGCRLDNEWSPTRRARRLARRLAGRARRLLSTRSS